MMMKTKVGFLLCGVTLFLLLDKSLSFKTTTRHQHDQQQEQGERKEKKKPPKPVAKEVCVLGGGASGAYSAYHLQKRGYDVVLMEPTDEIGGNCEVLHIPSTLNPPSTYMVVPAVIIFSPTPTVQSFFTEMGASTKLFAPGTQNFVYGLDGMPNGTVVPVPPQNVTELLTALSAYFLAVNTPPLVGVTIPPVPEWDGLSAAQKDALLQPVGAFLMAHPAIQPLVPLLVQLIQGVGYFFTLPVYQLLAHASPTFLAQILFSAYLELVNGCQSVYDELYHRMIAVNPKSVALNTLVTSIKRNKLTKKVQVKVKNQLTNKTTAYNCDKALVAFRPDVLAAESGSILQDITAEEQAFLGDLAYIGYVISIWDLDLGPGLIAGGMSLNQTLMVVNGKVLPDGIIQVRKTSSEIDFPWMVNYQQSSPPETPEEMSEVQAKIEAELTTMGFIIKGLIFIESHKYAMRPKSTNMTLQWSNFFRKANFEDKDNLYYTGQVPACTDASEAVWKYSEDLLVSQFPPKNN